MASASLMCSSTFSLAASSMSGPCVDSASSPGAGVSFATAVASCEHASDLLVTGGCYADPQWMAQLVASRPVAMTDSANAAAWRCDYKNTSPSSTIEVVAEAYCVAARE